MVATLPRPPDNITSASHSRGIPVLLPNRPAVSRAGQARVGCYCGIDLHARRILGCTVYFMLSRQEAFDLQTFVAAAA